MNGELTLKDLLNRIEDQFSYEEICRISIEQRAKYQALLEHFEEVHTQAKYSTAKKGAALEELVSYLLKISGNIFSITRNIRTSTNEVDQFVEVNAKGKVLTSSGLIPDRYANFLGECKNYQTSVGVTYVGKFCSLLQTTSIRTGILFSYHGISGKGWSDATGLVKKIYLQKEEDAKRTVIVDFSIEDFRGILEGKNFFEIVDAKLVALKLDTSVSEYITKHAAEDLI